MEDGEKAALAEKAKRLEGRQLYVKAAEAYFEAGMKEEAANAYETGGAYLKAEELYEKIGRPKDAARCKKKREDAANQPTWSDMHAEFQADRGNPY